jgi:hypothetical protein
MKKNERPKILTDLVSDMRERGLLLPGLILLVALVAVPVGLSVTARSMTPPAPFTSAASAHQNDSAVEPAVLTEQAGIRSYRKRLAALQQKNPFQRRFALPKVKTANPGALAPPVSTPSASATTPVSTPTTPSSGGTSSTPTTPSTSTVTVTTPTTTTTQHHAPTGLRLYTHVIDVKVGRLHERKTMTGVRTVTPLPGKTRPIVIFLGSPVDTNVAEFSVSTDAGSVNGDGECSPLPDDCQYLLMKPGDEETFKYTPDGKVYSLDLLRIRTIRVHQNRHTAHPKTPIGSGDLSVQK